MLRVNSIFLLLILGSCVLGDEASAVSPYDHAYLEMLEGRTVADGLSPVSVRVYGDYGATLTLHVSTGAHFLASSAGEIPGETTVHLGQRDEYGSGFAETQLVSTAAGLVELSFKLAPLAATLAIHFDPVVIEIGLPRAEELRPGVVVHELCIYANTSHGSIRSTASVGSVFPERVELQGPGERCGGAGSAWAGAAMLRWTSGEKEATLESAYLGGSSEQLGSAIAELAGEVFPGYHVVLYGTSVSAEWASVTAQLFYESTDTLASRVAASVPLGDLTSVPGGLTLVGSSSGSADATPETDADGMITLYFEIPDDPAPLSVFATPLGGGITLLGEV